MGKHGPKPGDAGYRLTPAIERILRRVEKLPSGCWEWRGHRNQKGYGKITVGSRIDGTQRCVPVHRVAYEALVGPIPDGLTIDHLCENKACCNPEHLEPVTNAENKRRAGERMDACRRGHLRTTENVYTAPTGKRHCRICKRLAAAARTAE